MANSDTRNVIGSDAWMLEQQLRAEWEAAEWRRIRAEMAVPLPDLIGPPAPEQRERRKRRFDSGGSIILKGLVRFGIGAFGGWMGYIVAANGELGQIEIWLAIVAGFFIALALSAIPPAKQIVALLAEMMRWMLVLGAIVGVVYLIAKMNNAA